MYVLVIEQRNPKFKTDEWSKYRQYVRHTKKELDERLNDGQWISNNYCQYRMTYYKVDLSSAVTVQSRIVLEEVK